MVKWQNGKMVIKLVEKAYIKTISPTPPEWQNGKMVKWQNGRMVIKSGKKAYFKAI